MATGTRHHIRLGRYCRQEPGQRSKFTRHISCGKGTSTDENSTEFMALPEFDSHVAINSDSLELYGEALLGSDVFGNVTQSTCEKMLEYGLKRKQNYLGQEILKTMNKRTKTPLHLCALRPSRNRKLWPGGWCRHPSWTTSSSRQ